MRPSVALVSHKVNDGGGMERAFYELIRRAHRDYRFVVVAHELAPELRSLVEWRRVPVLRRPIPVMFALFYIAAGLRLRSARCDLVHSLGAIVPNRVDVATVQFCQAGFVELTSRLGPEGAPLLRRLNNATFRLLALAAERWTYRPARVHWLAAVSRGVGAELKTHYPAVPVRLTPNAVDASRFAADPAGRAELRASLDVDPDDVVCLFVGGDWDRKGLGLAIEALARARFETAVPLRLWVVGGGERSRFEARAAEAAVPARFFGPRSDAERFYQAADIFVLPSAYETFSLAGHEAAAAALPLVCTRVSGLDELVGADEAGFIVARTAAAIAGALVRLAADRALRHRMGSAGRRRAVEFTWERSVSSVIEIYDELVRASRARALAHA